jgi:SOS-response transcriptional repressor LexA
MVGGEQHSIFPRRNEKRVLVLRRHQAPRAATRLLGVGPAVNGRLIEAKPSGNDRSATTHRKDACGNRGSGVFGHTLNLRRPQKKRKPPFALQRKQFCGRRPPTGEQGTRVMERYTADWVREQLDRTRRSRTELATALGVNPSQVTRLLAGERKIKAEEIQVLHAFFENDLARSATRATLAWSPAIPVLGKVAAGVWFEVQDVDCGKHEASPFPPDPRYPIEAQFDLVVDGTSIDRLAPDGYNLRCVDIAKAGIAVRDGDIVVVRRLRAGGALVETTVKRWFRKGDKVELRPYSTDARWQEPIELGSDGDEVAVTAKVLWTYRPAPGSEPSFD